MRDAEKYSWADELRERDQDERFGPFQSLCIWAIAGGACWYVLIEMYRFARRLLS